jgi:hypothetical protein
MVFAKRLREGVVCGEITYSVRIWTRPSPQNRLRNAAGPAHPIVWERPYRAVPHSTGPGGVRNGFPRHSGELNRFN